MNVRTKLVLPACYYGQILWPVGGWINEVLLKAKENYTKGQEKNEPIRTEIPLCFLKKPKQKILCATKTKEIKSV